MTKKLKYHLRHAKFRTFRTLRKIFDEFKTFKGPYIWYQNLGVSFYINIPKTLSNFETRKSKFQVECKRLSYFKDGTIFGD